MAAIPDSLLVEKVAVWLCQALFHGMLHSGVLDHHYFVFQESELGLDPVFNDSMFKTVAYAPCFVIYLCRT